MMATHFASFREKTIVGQDYHVFEKITEPKIELIIEEHEDKWYSTGCT